MTEDSHSDDPPAQGSVFGNLPDSRPGTRSPRRRTDGDAKGRSGARAAKAKAPASKAKSPPAAERAAPKQAAPKQAAPKQTAPKQTAPERSAGGEGGGGIEDLAWAGVAAAAEAATLGVRLASRALDALRGTSERD